MRRTASSSFGSAGFEVAFSNESDAGAELRVFRGREVLGELAPDKRGGEQECEKRGIDREIKPCRQGFQAASGAVHHMVSGPSANPLLGEIQHEFCLDPFADRDPPLQRLVVWMEDPHEVGARREGHLTRREDPE